VSVLSRATLWPHGSAWVPLVIAGLAILWVTRQGGGTATAGAAAAPPSELARRDSRRVRRLFRGLVIAFVAWIALMLILAAVAVSALHVHLGNGIGHRDYVVAGRADVRAAYKLGIGDLTVDLSKVAFAERPAHVSARVDVGRLTVIVPGGTRVRVTGDADYGNLELLGGRIDGHDKRATSGSTTDATLVLHTHVGAGVVRVVRGR
jgi:hypothetical protein